MKSRIPVPQKPPKVEDDKKTYNRNDEKKIELEDYNNTEFLNLLSVIKKAKNDLQNLETDIRGCFLRDTGDITELRNKLKDVIVFLIDSISELAKEEKWEENLPNNTEIN